ncbi:hypothetical protein JCM11251_002560 [Rhodosporidiobolus azoricus]
MASPSTSSSPSISLPLSSLVASHTPSHPLPRLLLDPILPRLALVESALLLSRPSSLLLRTGLASEKGLVSLAIAVVGAAVVKWRGQWRAMLWALGVGEAFGRTVEVLSRQEKGKGKATRDEGAAEQDSYEQDEEVQHVLSWWLLFALLSLLEAIRTTPTSSSSSSPWSLPTQLRTTLRSLRHTYLRFLRLYVLPPLLRARYAARKTVERYPSLDLSPHFGKLPSLALPALLQRRALPKRARGSFPEPRLVSTLSSPATNLPLSWSYLAPSSLLAPSPSPSSFSLAQARGTAEKRWELVKLLLLWVGLRRDGVGAKSVLWAWVLNPLFGGAEAGSGQGETGVEIRAFQRDGGKKVIEADSVNPAIRDGGSASQIALPDSRRSSSEHPTAVSSSSPSPYEVPFSPPPPAFSGASAASSGATWTPRSISSTPRRPRSRSPSPSHTPTPHRTPQYRPSSISTSHPLIPFSLSLPLPRTASPSSSAASNGAPKRGRNPRPSPSKRASLLFESPPRGPNGSHARSSSSSSSSSSLGDEERGQAGRGEEELDVPQTPGEEEAEEGVRGWGSVLGRRASDVGMLTVLEGRNPLPRLLPLHEHRYREFIATANQLLAAIPCNPRCREVFLGVWRRFYDLLPTDQRGATTCPGKDELDAFFSLPLQVVVGGLRKRLGDTGLPNDQDEESLPIQVYLSSVLVDGVQTAHADKDYPMPDSIADFLLFILIAHEVADALTRHVFQHRVPPAVIGQTDLLQAAVELGYHAEKELFGGFLELERENGRLGWRSLSKVCGYAYEIEDVSYEIHRDVLNTHATLTLEALYAQRLFPGIDIHRLPSAAPLPAGRECNRAAIDLSLTPPSEPPRRMEKSEVRQLNLFRVGKCRSDGESEEEGEDAGSEGDDEDVRLDQEVLDRWKDEIMNGAKGEGEGTSEKKDEEQ